MQRHILIVNYKKDSIPDIEKSKFYENMEFQTIGSARELNFPSSKKSPDIVVLFLRKEKQDCLSKIAYLTKAYLEKEIIAAVPLELQDTGVKMLQNGASDFFIFPSTVQTLDFYINRSLERNYLHKHICFNDGCYKSRFAVSEKNYKQLFNEVPCFIYVVDRDYQITDCNRKFVEYFGNHIGEYCFGILKNRDEPCSKCTISKTFNDGKNHAAEMQIMSSDGVRHVVLSWVAPILESSGRITKALVMLTDITEARNLEDHLTSLGFMLGSISHGLKGLLTGLDGGIYLMENGFEKGDEMRLKEGLNQSKQMASRIKKLVLDILYYTKTRKMEWSRPSCKQFVQDTIDIVSASAKKCGVKIETRMDIQAEDDSFEIDVESLQTALVNILENSIEACCDNIAGREPSILFHTRIDLEKVLFSIRDNGLGIDEDALKNIFTIFFSSKGNKGTGLGLYIANKVVGRHLGEIKVKSTKNKGSLFLIKIPRSVPETAKNPRGISYG